jgi:hypothetical protein
MAGEGKAFFDRHMQYIMANDVEGMVKDTYTEDAILFNAFPFLETPTCKCLVCELSKFNINSGLLDQSILATNECCPLFVSNSFVSPLAIVPIFCPSI